MDPRSLTPRAARPALPSHRSSVVAVIVRVPYDPVRPHAVADLLATAIRTTLATRESRDTDPPADAPPASGDLRLEVLAVGPHQINLLDEASGLCTVTYPAGSTTVLSVQPDGTVQSRPQGAAGVYERAILQSDRLIYAPTGPVGKVFVVPYVDVLPNPE
jgi:hypothetical protein